ncbi:unnamed protein product [Orchesella dallaii]|uniref:Cysteine/serine-rich nuclear protein N-terminal domain-containing protein n=1 Tax=Orchesella dallaii TaxID=48710 RepID=A0ABP1R782_9HEXA
MAPADKNKTLGASSSAKKDGKINASLNICKIKNIMRSLHRISPSSSSIAPPKNVSNISSHIEQGSSIPCPSNLTSSRGTSSNESEAKSNNPKETASIANIKRNISPIISLNATGGQDTSSTTSSVHEAGLLLHNNDPAAVLPEDNTDRALLCESLMAVVNSKHTQSFPGAIHVDGVTAVVCSSGIGRQNADRNTSIRSSDKPVRKGRDKTYTLLKEIEENFRMSLSPEGKVVSTACSLPDRSVARHTPLSPRPPELVVVKATVDSGSEFPSSPKGGSTLGMSMKHGFVEKFSVAEHVTEERKIHQEMVRKQPLSPNSSLGQLLPVKDSGLKEEEALSIAITQTQASDDSDRQE